MPQDQARGMPCRCEPGADHLTDREIEVLLLVADGRRNRQIAQLLGISTRTVDQHMQTMLRRVGAMSRGELIARCYAAGIILAGVWPPAWSGLACLAAGPGRAHRGVSARPRRAPER